MALKATVHRAQLELADIDRGVYASHSLTLARHPSETEERLMLRLLAFAMHADDQLAFGRGLSSEDEPDLWLKDATGAIQLWIDLGLPEEKRIRRAAGRAERVVLLAYGGRAIDVWWTRNAEALRRIETLSVIALPWEGTKELGSMADRAMQLHCTIQDGQILFGNADRSVTISPSILR
jgi:uncharacterized protein YaeQ